MMGLRMELLDVLAADFDRRGAKAIVTLRECSPVDYLRLIAAVLPEELWNEEFDQD